MSFVQPARRSQRHVLGVGIAIAVHVALVWGLMNGLARQIVQALDAPIETRIIEEVKPPPLPPPKRIDLPPPPKVAPPPPAFVPPPEVQVQAPSPQPAITVTTATPPAAPPAPAVPRAEPAPEPVRRAVAASVACSNYTSVMGDAAFPREATRLGLEEGSAVIQFTLGASGELRDIQALRASHPVFARNSIRLVSQYKCAGQGRDVVVQVPFAYKSE